MSATIEKLDVPHLSVAERDRRWAKVRDLMDRDGLDLIVAPAHTGHHDHFQANVRYLTGIGGYSLEAAAIFPRHGEVTAVTVPDVPREHWLARQDWITDVRPCQRRFAEGIVERLRELSPGKVRIGLAGLRDVTRFPDGVVSHTTFVKIQEAFPAAELVDATWLLEEAKFVKSPEEITCLEKSTALAEVAIEVMRREARPGVPDNVVYARMICAMAERGGEVPTMLLWSVSPPHGARRGPLPTQRPIQVGDVIASEIEGRWAGYVGQATQPGVIGPAPTLYREMFQLQQEALARCYEVLRPGATIADVIRAAEQTETGPRYVCCLIIHSRGLGDDAPMVIQTTDDSRMLAWVVEENSTFMIKPRIMLAEDPLHTVTWGDTVQATPQGARRLGRRQPELLEIT